ncbi:SDR family NAD(P)-dependent oxidoreductase [Streptomyces sp. NPDC050560]|uniref:SDR family NAD(P)-dependent oxidoreductase n=1 Tax=Streptomyces sp. NPDC050560 TaxID=3365630 RepID=UPI0037909B82
MPAAIEFPASFDQERMWFLHRLDPHDPSYNVPFLLRLRGPLDHGRLERALAGVAARHEILRTTYAAGADGSLVQRVHEAGAATAPPLPLDALDAPPGEPPAEDPAVRERVRAFVRAPFDLTARPPVRALLLRLAEDDHLLLFCLHHIAVDGWSLGVLVRDLDELYRADAGGRAPRLAELPVQYGDYAEWQRATLGPGALAARIDEWGALLGGRVPELTLPTDRPRPERPSGRGARVDFALSPAVGRELRELARRHGASLNMTLLAAWTALLHRCGAGERIVVGTLLANRDNEQLTPLIGLFVNTLPVRVDVAGGLPFTQLLARTRRAALDVLARQDTPVDQVAREFGDTGAGRRDPLFQVLFALQNFADQRLELGGLDVERVDDEEESTRFDLELHLWEHPDRLRGSLVFDTDLFDRDTAQRLAAHYVALLDAVVADPAAAVAALPLRPAAQERALRERMAAGGGPLVLDAGGMVPPEGVPGEVWRVPAGGGEPERTGERAVVRPSGAVEVLSGVGADGVVPGLVCVGGVTVRPCAVAEELLRRFPALADAVVVPRVPLDGPAELLAYVVPAGPVDLDAVAGALPAGGSAVPVSRLPLTPGGSVDVPALLRLPVADAVEARRWERALGGRCAVLPVAAPPARPARIRVPKPPRAPRERAPLAAAPGAIREALADGGPPVPPLDRTLGDSLARAVGSASGGVVLLDEEGRESALSYGELRERALRALGGLHALGAGPGDRVLLQLDDHADFLTVLWACLLGGQVAVPLAVPPDYRAGDAAVERLGAAWEMLGRPLVVTGGDRLGELEAAAAERGWTGLSAAGAGELAGGTAAVARPAAPDDPVLLMLTSGSTGRPKAVVLRHRNVLARCAGTAAANGLGADEVSFNWMPLDHVGGVVMFHLRDVYLGCRQVHAPTRWVLRDPLRWLDAADRFGASVTWAPNFAFALVNDRAGELAARGAGWDLSRLRFVMNAGEAIVPRVARRWLSLLAPYGLPGGAMRPAWGMSETSSAVAYSDRFGRETTSDDDAFTEVGAPLPGCALRIVAADGAGATRVVPEGTAGLLQVRGATVTSGYHEAPEQNEAAFTADGWFDTGDLATIRDGRLTITGRAKDVVILNGVNHHSHEIESAVEELDCVEPSFTAAVAVRPAAAVTDELAVFFCPRGGADPEEAAGLVRRAVFERIGVNPRHLVPVAPAEIPKTAIGKIQRAALRTAFEAGEFAARLPGDGAGAVGTVPAHFHRPRWVPRRLPGGEGPRHDAGCVVVFGDPGGALAGRLTALVEAAGRPCALVEPEGAYAAGPVRLGRGRYALAPSDAEGHRGLGALLEADGAAPGTVVDLRAYGEPSGTGDGGARAELHALLHLAQGTAGAGTVCVVTSRAQRAAAGDPPCQERAPLAGLAAALGHERPGARVVHVDVPPGDPEAVAGLLLAELSAAPRDPAVAYRDGRRLVRRLVPVEPGGDTADRVPFRAGGRYLVTGASGGIGRLLVAELTGAYGARVLAVGRSVPASPQPPGVEHAAVDLRQPGALDRAVRAAERRWGARLDGVVHLAGEYREVPLDTCTAAALDEAMAVKAGGARALHALVADRPGTLFVSFSSVNGFFGGASVGGYAAAGAFLDALAEHQREDLGLDAYSLAWSMWDETGMSAGHPLKRLTRARGYRVLAPDEALASLSVALRTAAPHQLVGLDPERPWVASRLAGPGAPGRVLSVFAESDGDTEGPVYDRFGARLAARRVVVDALPVDPATGLVDRERLSDAGAAPERDEEPRPGVEAVIAAVWSEVLGTGRVTARSNFFDLGGGSLQATRVHGLLQERLGRELSMVELFRRPTVRALADALDAGQTAPAGGRGRARAQRRRAAARGER